MSLPAMTELIWSFAPWLAFLLAMRVTSFYGAVAAAVAVAAVVLRAPVIQWGCAGRRIHVTPAKNLSGVLS